MLGFDINYAVDIKEVNIILVGWYPMTVRYGLYKISEKTYLLWNVKGTTNTFSIPLRIVIEKHAGNYKAHFELTLIKFREDLLRWIEEGLTEDWMLNYYNNFKDFIKNQL